MAEPGEIPQPNPEDIAGHDRVDSHMDRAQRVAEGRKHPDVLQKIPGDVSFDEPDQQDTSGAGANREGIRVGADVLQKIPGAMFLDKPEQQGDQDRTTRMAHPSEKHRDRMQPPANDHKDTPSILPQVENMADTIITAPDNEGKYPRPAEDVLAEFAQSKTEEAKRATREHVARRLDLTYPDGSPLGKDAAEHALRSVDAQVVDTLGDLLRTQEAGGPIDPGKLWEAKLLAESVQRERQYQEFKNQMLGDRRKGSGNDQSDLLGRMVNVVEKIKKDTIQDTALGALKEFPANTKPAESAEPQTPPEPSEKPKE